MAKRDIVNVDCEKVIPLIRANEWNNFAFSRKVGKYNSWFGEVLRGKNLPSPEEAARMCMLLNTTPEEILLHEGKNEKETVKCQKDIKLVQELLEKEQSIKKAPADKGEGLDPKTQEILDFIDSASFDELNQVFRFVSYLRSQRGDKA